jgi:flavin-dependent dehydrogenase
VVRPSSPRRFTAARPSGPSPLELEDGSRVAVVGGGPAGSFFSTFCIDLAVRAGLDLSLDLYEYRDFSSVGPAGCNMCGGIISETLVQNLAAEGINLPPSVVQRGIDSYVLHMDVGSVGIQTPLQEKRIGAVHRGAGPRDLKTVKWESFDAHLQSLALARGANLVRAKVERIVRGNGRPRVTTKDGGEREYDLVVVAAGINSGAPKLLQNLDFEYDPPATTKTSIREFFLGEDVIESMQRSSMHVFLLNIPRLEFAAIIPKGDYVSACLLGEDIDKRLLESFLQSPEVRRCMPVDWNPARTACQCGPRINIRGSPRPYTDRIVLVGDAGVTRLYKDGIGAAYRTAKAAAATAVLHGVSAADFERHYMPVCRSIHRDNNLGKVVFAFTRQVQKRALARRAIHRMVMAEQGYEGKRRRMSLVLWDTFTGSATYREILLRALHPAFVMRLFRSLLGAAMPRRSARNRVAASGPGA